MPSEKASNLHDRIGITPDQLAKVLDDPKCPPREKFLREDNYIKRLAKISQRLGFIEPAPAPAPAPKGHVRERTRRRTSRSRREQREANQGALDRHRAKKRELPELPAIQDPARREACATSFRLHCETYHSDMFYADWGADHLAVIDRIERAILHGGRFCLAVFRGFGKTTLCVAGLIWATINGHSRHAVLIGAEKEAAVEVLDKIKVELETNDLLAADYPEICVPFHVIEGNPHKGRYLTYRGKRIRIESKAARVRFPVMGYPKTDGTLIRVYGITGRIRGANDPLVGRPDLALLDDPQTDESSCSPGQCNSRIKTIRRAVLGLAGHDKRITALMPCTVIERDDVTEQILSDPVWQAFKGKLVYDFPEREDLWDEYAEIRRRVLSDDELAQEATDFYVKHQKEMDRGCVLGWDQMWDESCERSAIQHAMNLKIDDEEGFWAEYQNEPIIPDSEVSKIPGTHYLLQVRTGFARNVVPDWASILTAGMDLQDNLIYWMVCAFDDDFHGGPIAYGTLPDQKRADFRCRTAPHPLGDVYDGGPAAVILQGATKIGRDILGYEWRRPNGQAVPVNTMLIDAGYKPKVAREVRRLLENGAVHIAHGRGITVDRKPMIEYKRHPGDRFGVDWYIPAKTDSGTPHVLFDANAWKTRVLEAWNTTHPEPGSFCIFGESKERHSLLSRHLFQSETYAEVQGTTRKILEWRNPSGRDNHWLDNLVQCYVGASMAGARVIGQPVEPVKKRRRRRSMREMKDAARGKRI